MHFERMPVICFPSPIFLSSSYLSLILTLLMTINSIWSFISNKAISTVCTHQQTFTVSTVNWVFATHPKTEVEWSTPSIDSQVHSINSKPKSKEEKQYLIIFNKYRASFASYTFTFHNYNRTKYVECRGTGGKTIIVASSNSQ